ncbi:hypothetical protein Y032_0326g2564 [Ancylostoma ceylanicum]|uniref:Uncharacterized protein n=1 Tax=Ancylostoma ceylanicum TaxID=53326 RepID=A0A016RZX9_9BILA|nr:hypothetical protein Y032_0326g2564 [Ancylostoma ceylanicum]
MKEWTATDRTCLHFNPLIQRGHTNTGENGQLAVADKGIHRWNPQSRRQDAPNNGANKAELIRFQFTFLPDP